jgi:ketosteroid isomerase-like protein
VSQENVEVVLRLQFGPDVDVAKLFRDDDIWAALTEPLAAVLHPEFECVAHGVDARETFSGVDGMRDFWLDWLAPWTTYRSEVEDALDCGDRVLVLVREFGRRKGSTEEIMGRNAGVFTVRDGKILRVDAYAVRAEAL